jgi:hypothetical protein
MNYEKFKRSDRPDRFRSLTTVNDFLSVVGEKFFNDFAANEYTANVIYCSPQLCIFLSSQSIHVSYTFSCNTQVFTKY